MKKIIKASFDVSGHGNMEELIKNNDWAASPLGAETEWDGLLKHSLSIILNAAFPMLVLWGEDLVCLYNDAYKPLLGTTGKHPKILGKPAKIAFPEVWERIEPLFREVFTSGKPLSYEDVSLPFERNGRIEEVFWTFSYNPLKDENGTIKGILVICTDTTERVTKFQNLVKHSTSPIIIFKGEALVIEDANQAAFDLWQVSPDVIGKSLTEAVPEMKDQVFVDLLLKVYRTGEKVHGTETPAYFIRENNTREVRYFNFEYSPYREHSGDITGVMVLATDVTGQVLAKRQITIAEEEMRQALDAAELGYWHVDPQTSQLICNKKTKHLFGLPEDEQVDLTLAINNIHEDDRQRVIDAINAVLQFGGDGRYDIDYRVIHPVSKEIFFVRAKGQAYFNEEQVAYRFSGILLDVTDRKRIEEALNQAIIDQRDTLAQLESLLVNAPVGVAFFDTKYRYVRVNETLAEINGLPVEAHLGNEIADILPGMVNDVYPLLDQIMQTKQPVVNIEVSGETPRQPGVKRYWLTGFYPICVTDKETIDYLGVIVLEISDRKNAEKSIRESETQFRVLANSIAQLAWIADAEGSLYWYNQRWYDYTGTTLEEMKGWGWQKVHHPEHVDRVVRFITEAWKTSQPWELTFPLRGIDGTYRWFLTRAYPVLSDDGQVLNWIGSNTDITEQLELQNALQQSQFQLKEAADLLEQKVQERTGELKVVNETLLKVNAELQQFNYVTAHDLQEPLRKVTLFAELIRNEDEHLLSEASKKRFQRLTDAVHRMRNALRDLLDYTSLNKYSEMTDVDLNDVVANVEVDLELILQQKNGKILRDKLPTISAIPLQMHQLFYNLLNNALKYSKTDIPPVVKISVADVTPQEQQQFKVPQDAALVKIIISDNGIGFEQDFREKIFEIFQRLHTRSDYAGTGIGLALCRKVTDNHKGVIYADGVVGEGATFTVLLPRK